MKKMKKFKDSLFIKSCTLVKHNFLKFLYMLFLDFLFILLISIINRFLAYFLPASPEAIASLARTQALYVLLPIPLYFLTAILVYSVLKYIIMHNINSLFSEKKLDFKKLPRFYLLNSILAISLIVSLFLLNSFYLFNVKPENLNAVYALTMLPFIALFYAFLNITHSLFIQNFHIRQSLAGAFNITFNKLQSYLPLLLFFVIYSVAYYLLYIALIAKFDVAIAQMINLITFYLMIAFNRIYFYIIVDKENPRYSTH